MNKIIVVKIVKTNNLVRENSFLNSWFLLFFGVEINAHIKQAIHKKIVQPKKIFNKVIPVL
jgi:hypothetical protein